MQSGCPANIPPPYPPRVLAAGGGRECGGGYRREREVLYRGPVGPNLPLAADLELAGAGGLRLLQVLASVGLHRQAAVGIHLAAQDLAVLHAQATGFAALGPLPDVPAGSWSGWGGGERGDDPLTGIHRKTSGGPLPRAVPKGHVTVREPVGHAVYHG